VVDIDTDEITIGAAADFDYDAETRIRWRGLGHARGLGACCYIDPADPEMATTICADGMTRAACDILEGDFAANQICDDDPCPGACCEDDGDGGFICEDLSETDCEAVGGEFRGVNTACDDDPDPCIVGVCCLSSAGCFDQNTYPSQEDCENAGGEWFTDAHCDDDPNPCAGACCLIDAEVTCDDLTEVDCDGIDGGFQGIGTTCADVPDPCGATGACCQGDEICSEETEDDCVDLIGGSYLGDDVPCDPNPCVCPTITILCDSIHASKCKCGFEAFDGSGTFYLGQFDSYSDQCCGCVPLSHPRHCSPASGSSSWTVNPDTCGHTGAGVVSCTDLFGTTTFTIGPATSPGSIPPLTSGVVSGLSATGFSLTLISNIGGSCDGDFPDGYTTTATALLSDEYTTSVLISNVEAALPDYFGHFGCEENVEIGFRDEGQNCTCFSSRALASDESCYEINRFKYIFTFPEATSDFTIEWTEHTDFEDGSTSDVPMSESISIGETESSEHECLEPSENGTVRVIDITCTVG
jgi:hypothetical protein